MILLKCPSCGHTVEIIDALRRDEIRCARCGQVLESTAAEGPHTEIGVAPILGSASAEIATSDHDNEDTLSPKPTARADSFPFLSPPKTPGEIGWLGNYRVMRMLFQGGMGIVFEAIDTSLKRTVALKVMKPELAQDKAANQRFLREAHAMAAIRSDHVVDVYRVDVANNVPYMAMEFLRGETLDKWLEHHGRASLAECLRLGSEVAQGLAAAHELGLIHRDIKPGNIFIETRGNERSWRAKILDFGLVRAIGPENVQLTNSGMVMGTPAYMAPEQVEGAALDARCDLFSLGCILYLLTTGQTAFSGSSSLAIMMAVANNEPKPPRALNPELPLALNDLILKLLAKQPADRPRSAQEVVAALDAIAQEPGFSPATPSRGATRTQVVAKLTTTGGPRRTARWIAVLIVVGVLAIIALLLWPFVVPHGVSEREVRLGMSAPFHGPAAELGREMSAGIRTCFDDVNDRGGVAGRKITLIELDDGYEPGPALANMKKLVENHKVFAVIGNVGTPTAEATFPYARDHKLLFFGAYTGTRLLRQEPPDHHVFNYRASLEEETAAIVKYFVEVEDIRPEAIAVFAQNDGYGDDAFAGVVKRLKQYGRDAKTIVRVGYDRNTPKIADAAKTILAHPEIKAIVMVPTYKPAALFIQSVKEKRPDMRFASVSFVGIDSLAAELRSLGPEFAAGVIVSQVVPPVDSGSTLVMKYRELLEKYRPRERPTATSLEGYITAAIFAEGLRKAGPDLTTERMIAALESIHKLDLGTGAPISFGPSEHQASHKVWGLQIDKNGNHRPLEDFK